MDQGRPGEGVLNGGEKQLSSQPQRPLWGPRQHTAHTWEETAPGDGSSYWGRGHARWHLPKQDSQPPSIPGPQFPQLQRHLTTESEGQW